MKGGMETKKIVGYILLVIFCICLISFMSGVIWYETKSCKRDNDKPISNDNCYCEFLKECEKDKYCTEGGKCQTSPGS